MQKKDEFEKILIDYYNNKEYKIPKEISNNILKKFEQLNEKQPMIEMIRKIVTFIIGLLVLAGGAVFAGQTIKQIQFHMSKEMESAIENGYIEESPQTIVENGKCEVTIETVLMDDFNISFISKVNFSNIDRQFNNISSAHFEDIVITDENENILYFDNKETLSTYCSNNNLDYENSNSKKYSSGTNYFVETKRGKLQDDDSINIVYNIYNNTNYPKSQKLYINFNKVVIEEMNNKIEIDGKWNIEIDLPEKFYNRENIIYRTTENSKSELQVQEAIVYNTGMKFEFVTWEEPWYDENDSEEVRNKKLDKIYEEMYQQMHEVAKTGDDSKMFLVTDIYVENEDGEKFYPSRSSSEDSGTLREPNGRIQYYQTFNLTKQDATDKLTIYFKYKGETVIMKLSNK